MNKSIAIHSLALAAAITLLAVPGKEQQSVRADDGHSHAAGSHSDHSHGATSIAYRLSDWKTLEYDDAGKAGQHLQAVKKLGCEARQEGHDGHVDVTYRSPRWQVLEVETDQLAHQWESWLKGAGFETLHGHPEDHEGHDHSNHSHGPEGAEHVAYRLANWKTIHADDQRRHAETVALLKGLGCEVKADGHDGHSDVTFRCPEWMHLELASHQAAQGWEDWLTRSGFEVRHDH